VRQDTSKRGTVREAHEPGDLRGIGVHHARRDKGEEVREIRFRAWHRDHKAMRMVRGLFWDADDQEKVELFDVHLSEENPMWCSFMDVEIMQYTGLNDKNGREIYEGDIVRLFNDDVKEVKFFDDLGYDSSFGKASGFYFYHELEYYDGGPKDWEVIGNIYESPELLK
jgi:uncharacterized phage protein (TIGR01671 family)